MKTMLHSTVKKLKRLCMAACIIYLIAFPLLYTYAPRYLGMMEAKYDLWNKHYEIRIYGLHFIWPEYVERLGKYYIALVRVAGCRVDHFIRKYVEGYNTEMKKGLNNIFKEDIFE